MPSPASSAGSQTSAGSSMGAVGATATVSTPVTIQNMTSSYVTITSHVLKAFTLWEQAEALTRKNKGEWLCYEGGRYLVHTYILSREAAVLTLSTPLRNLVVGIFLEA